MTDLAAAIVAATHHPLLVLDGALQVRLANPAFCATFGVSRDDAEGSHLGTLGDGTLGAPDLHDRLRALLGGGSDVRAHRLEEELDGTGRRVVLVHARRLTHEGNTILVTFEEPTSVVDSELLLAELNHRVKNTLAVVQAMAAQTIARSRSLEEFGVAFQGRLDALARGHDQLAGAAWRAADLQDVVTGVVATFREDGRVQAEGPSVHLHTRTVLALTLVLHELETNATKYGALSVENGRIDISWSQEGDGAARVVWRERNGPRVAAPERQGFGTRLIKELVAYELDGDARLDFRPEGLVAEIRFPAPGA